MEMHRHSGEMFSFVFIVFIVAFSFLLFFELRVDDRIARRMEDVKLKGFCGVRGELVNFTAARLVGTYSPGAMKNAGMYFRIIHWSVDYVVNVRYSNGNLIIPRDGVYVVYSQVGFVRRYLKRVKGGLIVSHSIARFNVLYPNGGKEVLLKSRDSDCFVKNRTYYATTTYLNAALYLREGDQIFVQVYVSKADEITFNPLYTFFGLYTL